jgi:hypothetical protein
VFAEALTVVPASGGPARVLVESKAGAKVGQVAWSPGGEALAYIRRGDNQSVEVVTLDGTITELATVPAWGLAFSVDGRQLAFHRFPPDPNEPAEVVVFRFSGD